MYVSQGQPYVSKWVTLKSTWGGSLPIQVPPELKYQYIFSRCLRCKSHIHTYMHTHTHALNKIFNILSTVQTMGLLWSWARKYVVDA